MASVESNGQNGLCEAPIQSGGAASSLDLTSEKDRGLLRMAMTWWPDRWRGLTPEFKDNCTRQLQYAIDEIDGAAEKDPMRAAEARLSIAKTAAMMEGQRQKDQHKAVDVAFKNHAPPPVQINNFIKLYAREASTDAI